MNKKRIPSVMLKSEGTSSLGSKSSSIIVKVISERKRKI
jgi:hypothetical protein